MSESKASASEFSRTAVDHHHLAPNYLRTRLPAASRWSQLQLTLVALRFVAANKHDLIHALQSLRQSSSLIRSRIVVSISFLPEQQCQFFVDTGQATNWSTKFRVLQVVTETSKATRHVPHYWQGPTGPLDGVAVDAVR